MNRLWTIGLVIVSAALLAVAFVWATTKPAAEETVAPVVRGDRLVSKVVEPPAVVPVRTIPIVPTPPIPVTPAEAPPSLPPVVAAVPTSVAFRYRDICQRHGMHKVWVGKYRWRCSK